VAASSAESGRWEAARGRRRGGGLRIAARVCAADDLQVVPLSAVPRAGLGIAAHDGDGVAASFAAELALTRKIAAMPSERLAGPGAFDRGREAGREVCTSRGERFGGLAPVAGGGFIYLLCARQAVGGSSTSRSPISHSSARQTATSVE
jgi:hypothetical protein